MTTRPTRSGAQALVESLLAEGLDTVFGIPGVGTLPVYDAMLDHPALRHIETRHEQGAVFMADGHARATGDIGVAFSSGGPGALNTLTAMATAFNDSVPVFHLTSENPAPVRRKGRGHFHDISDQFGIFRPVSDHATQVVLADEIPAAVHATAAALRNRRPRPALLEVAVDAFADATAEPVLDRAVPRPRPPAGEQVAAAVRILGGAQRPVIWGGGGVATPAAATALTDLAELLGAPVLTSQTGKGSVPASHPLHIGNWANEQPVRDLIRSADAVLAVGTRFSYFPTGGWTLDITPPLVQIDMDAAEIGRNYRVAAGVVGDAELSLRAIHGALVDEGVGSRVWRTAEVQDILSRIAAAVGRPLELQVLEAIRSALPAEALVFNDPTTIAFWARSLWPSEHPHTWFVPSGFGTLGYALPASIGAKVARPDVPCVAIMGDAGVMFTIQDLMTAVQERIPIVLMVFNDRGYGVERRHQDHLYGRRNAVDIEPPDFVALARAFGATGELVRDPLDVGRALESALDADRPVLLEIPNQFGHPGYGAFGNWDT